MIEMVFFIRRRLHLIGMPFIFLLSSLLIGQLNLFAQNDIRFERISTDDGLSQSSITSIIQDQYGYLWIATLDGLNRYNGKDFKIYQHDNKNKHSLYSNYVKALTLDADQQLWLVFDNAIARYEVKTDAFINYPIKLSPTNESIIIFEIDFLNKNLILLSTNVGLIEFDLENKEAKPSVNYATFAGKKISSYARLSALGELVVAKESAFFRFANTDAWEILVTDSLSLCAYVSEPTQEIYFQTKSALLKYDLLKRKHTTLEAFEDLKNFNPNQNGLIKLSTGELWVYRNGLHIYDREGKLQSNLVSIPQNPNSLSGNLISCIYESKDQVVWVGTNGFGLNKYNPQLSVFKYIGAYKDAPLSLSNNFVKSIFTTDDEQIFIGTFSGLDVVDLKKNVSKHYEVQTRQKERALINKIIEAADKTIWLFTTKGLMKWRGNEVVPGGIALLDRPDVNIFTGVAFDSTTYLLTTNIGMFKVDFLRKQAVKLNDFRSMVVGKWRDQFWIESSENIRLLNSDAIATTLLFKKDSGDSTQFLDTEVKCFYTDAAGTLWIGTWGQGLMLYDHISKKFQVFNEADGLPNAVVYGILEDSAGYLWLSTNKGICVFDKKLKKVIRNFEKADGLQGNEFNTNAYFKSTAGNFYFGGINGLTYFKPAEASAIKSSIPKSIVTGFFINQTRVDSLQDGTVISQYGDQHIELEWGEQNFGFEVAGLGFNFPGRTRLKYQLENFDADWSFVEDETRISYTNVPPGKYTLRVLASNSFGDWETNGLSIQITVNGPFWKSPYFLFSLVLGSLVFFVLTYYWRVSSLKRRSIYLEKLVASRTQEIQKMNEEIAAQNEEISSQNEELTTQSEALSIQNQELNSIRASLEKKVQERTLILQNVNNKLIEQNVQLEQFSFITAHNIRGPLARIKGLIQLLPQKDLLEIEHLKRSVQNLDDIISDLGTIINIRDGASRLIEPVSLKHAWEHTLQTLEKDIKAKNVAIDQSDFQEYMIRGIAPYVMSIFHNLVHNALKYSDNIRQPVIKITTSKTGEEVVVTIADNGIGIDMRYAEGKWVVKSRWLVNWAKEAPLL
ncbi:MAG: hypothetical protein EBR30_25305 [Cytophagia bacterium]|nr:hypothetical protein [Cytophagia bacterium]